MSALSALLAALRVYAVGIAVALTQLLRRLRGGFQAPGECVRFVRGSRRGSRRRAGVAESVKNVTVDRRLIVPPPAGCLLGRTSRPSYGTRRWA